MHCGTVSRAGEEREGVREGVAAMRFDDQGVSGETITNRGSTSPMSSAASVWQVRWMLPNLWRIAGGAEEAGGLGVAVGGGGARAGRRDSVTQR